MNRITKIALAGAAFGLLLALLNSCGGGVVHKDKLVVHDCEANFDSACQELLDSGGPVRQRI